MDMTKDSNPTHEYINEYVEMPGGYIVNKYSIGASTMIDYDVWEPLNGHSTISSIGEQRVGKLTTRPLPTEIDALPGWTPGYWPVERLARADAFHAELERQAEALIKAAFPQDF